MTPFCCKLWNQQVWLQAVEWNVSCYEFFNKKFLLRIADWEVFVGNCGIKTFCCELWNQMLLLQIVKSDVFAMNCLITKSSSKLWNENCLLQIVEWLVSPTICGMASRFLWIVKWETFAANFGMRNETFFAANCKMRTFCCILWIEKLSLQIVEWEIFVTNCGLRSFCCKVWNEKFL